MKGYTWDEIHSVLLENCGEIRASANQLKVSEVSLRQYIKSINMWHVVEDARRHGLELAAQGIRKKHGPIVYDAVVAALARNNQLIEPAAKELSMSYENLVDYCRKHPQLRGIKKGYPEHFRPYTAADVRPLIIKHKGNVSDISLELGDKYNNTWRFINRIPELANLLKEVRQQSVAITKRNLNDHGKWASIFSIEDAPRIIAMFNDPQYRGLIRLVAKELNVGESTLRTYIVKHNLWDQIKEARGPEWNGGRIVKQRPVKVPKKAPAPVRETLSEDKVREHLVQNHGALRSTARTLYVSENTLRRYLKANPQMMAVYKQLQEDKAYSRFRTTIAKEAARQRWAAESVDREARKEAARQRKNEKAREARKANKKYERDWGDGKELKAFSVQDAAAALRRNNGVITLAAADIGVTEGRLRIAIKKHKVLDILVYSLRKKPEYEQSMRQLRVEPYAKS